MAALILAWSQLVSWETIYHYRYAVNGDHDDNISQFLKKKMFKGLLMRFFF